MYSDRTYTASEHARLVRLVLVLFESLEVLEREANRYDVCRSVVARAADARSELMDLLNR
jgi:hypothetical protein